MSSIPAIQALSQATAMIEDDLRAVEALFDEELRGDLHFVQELCDHIRRYRGKMMRPILLLLSARACGRVTREHITLAAVVEMVHMATLVHDDVLDEADVRRNLPTLCAMTTNETAVLIGDYLISHAYHLCSSLDSQYAARTIASCTNTVCEGELLQVSHRMNWDLTVEDYMTIVSRKTAALTSTACLLGARYAGAEPRVQSAMESYGMDAGIAFQIVDDVLDVVGSEDEVGKSLGLDLARGKPTLPVISFLAQASPAERPKLQTWLSSTSRDEVVAELSDHIEHAREAACQRVQSAIEQLGVLPPSPAREALQSMAEFITQRRL